MRTTRAANLTSYTLQPQHPQHTYSSSTQRLALQISQNLSNNGPAAQIRRPVLSREGPSQQPTAAAESGGAQANETSQQSTISEEVPKIGERRRLKKKGSEDRLGGPIARRQSARASQKSVVNKQEENAKCITTSYSTENPEPTSAILKAMITQVPREIATKRESMSFKDLQSKVNTPRSINSHQLNNHQNIDPHPMGNQFLPPQSKDKIGMKTLILDLDETLVHSSFKPHSARMADIMLPVYIEGRESTVYVLVRPGAIEFCERMSQIYEVVIFTASLSKYAEPLIKLMDRSDKWCSHILFREHCTFLDTHEAYVKDLSLLNRPLKDLIIIDNSPTSYHFHPENALPSKSWYEDDLDRELFEFTPLLQTIAKVNDVRPILNQIGIDACDRVGRDVWVQSVKALWIAEKLLRDELAQKENTNKIQVAQHVRQHTGSHISSHILNQVVEQHDVLQVQGGNYTETSQLMHEKPLFQTHKRSIDSPNVTNSSIQRENALINNWTTIINQAKKAGGQLSLQKKGYFKNGKFPLNSQREGSSSAKRYLLAAQNLASLSSTQPILQRPTTNNTSTSPSHRVFLSTGILNKTNYLSKNHLHPLDSSPSTPGNPTPDLEFTEQQKPTGPIQLINLTQKTKLISEIPQIVGTQENTLGELQLHIKKHQGQRAIRNYKQSLPSQTYERINVPTQGSISEEQRLNHTQDSNTFRNLNKRSSRLSNLVIQTDKISNPVVMATPNTQRMIKAVEIRDQLESNCDIAGEDCHVQRIPQHAGTVVIHHNHSKTDTSINRTPKSEIRQPGQLFEKSETRGVSLNHTLQQSQPTLAPLAHEPAIPNLSSFARTTSVSAPRPRGFKPPNMLAPIERRPLISRAGGGGGAINMSGVYRITDFLQQRQLQ
ncbi:hypothetical protein FGO68_gene3206 [Halteria grandinella]|uniref:FCP1 homology domain-containing protein n=1 Tax=Halteria grandinella TaxID=5974 RepID=A0A8J8P135_HALGN|nr:hypothetical protein FGO68_gene3206 [Halteria grandinella]